MSDDGAWCRRPGGFWLLPPGRRLIFPVQVGLQQA